LTGLRRSSFTKAVAKKHGKHGTHSNSVEIQRIWIIFEEIELSSPLGLAMTPARREELNLKELC